MRSASPAAGAIRLSGKALAAGGTRIVILTEKNAGDRRGVLSFSVEPPEPRDGIGRFDLAGDFGFRHVGLRSQSLADPTLRFRALSGRRAEYQW